MIDPELKEELQRIEGKVDAAREVAERTRRWIKWSVIGTILLIVLPLLIIPFAVGSLLSNYSSVLSF